MDGPFHDAPVGLLMDATASTNRMDDLRLPWDAVLLDPSEGAHRDATLGAARRYARAPSCAHPAEDVARLDVRAYEGVPIV